LSAIEAAALLHDLGKLVVPEHILNKPGKLTTGEFERMKLHAGVGADILSSIRFPYPVVPIVRHHHENWDGSGYPDGLKGTQIPLGARILSVVDCFDALTSDRPYRPRLPDDEAIAILMSRRGTMYDPLVVDTFIAAKDELAEAYLRSVAVEEAKPLPPKDRNLEPVEHIPSLNPDLARALRTILTSVQEELRTSLVLVFLRDSANDDVYVAEVFGPEASRVKPFRLSIGSRVTGWVVANGRRIANADSQLELENVFKDNRVCLSVPLTLAGDVVGALTLFLEPGQAFDDASIFYVESVAKSFDEPPLQGLMARQTGNRPPVVTQRATIH
jgi:putative nucleotidyltransferase with HDIG domain